MTRGSRPVLREPEGEVPLGYSPVGWGSPPGYPIRRLFAVRLFIVACPRVSFLLSKTLSTISDYSSCNLENIPSILSKSLLISERLRLTTLLKIS